MNQRGGQIAAGSELAPSAALPAEAWALASETVITQRLVDHLRELTTEALAFETGFALAPDRYVLRVLGLLADIRTATERAQRLIVERNILSARAGRPSARRMADATKMSTSTLTRWAARPLRSTAVDPMFDQPQVDGDKGSSVTALEALLSENESLRAQLAATTPVPADKSDGSDGQEFSPGELVLYGLADQPQNRYSAAEIAMMDEQAAIADEEAEAPSRVAFMKMHVGRSVGTRRHIEDACICPQEPCGLIAQGRIDPDCEQHGLGRILRQCHTPAQCAAVAAALAAAPPVTAEEEPANAWMSREFDRAGKRRAQLSPGAGPVVTLPHQVAADPPADR